MDDNFEVAIFFSTNSFRNVGKEYVNVGNLVEYLVWMGVGGWVVDWWWIGGGFRFMGDSDWSRMDEVF